MKKHILILLLAFPLLGCFHKDVMNDAADNVEQSFIYTGDEGTFIITKEEIFQATSKESGGGVTHISGYAEYRLTSYDINTGEQISRVEMGEGQEDAFYVLGCTPGKLWIYSVNTELGFHCRNPKTLEVLQAEKDLAATEPLSGFAFARPEWMMINQQYGFHFESGEILLSDMQDYHYLYNPTNNTLTETDEDISDPDFGADVLNSNAYFDDENYVSIQGNGRNKLTWHYEEAAHQLSFLDGEILMDVNHNRVEKMRAGQILDLQNMVQSFRDTMNMLEQKFPPLKTGDRWSSASSKVEYKVWNDYEQYQREIDDVQRKIDQIKEGSGFAFDNVPLSPEPFHILMLHGTNVSDTSHLQISYVFCSENSFKEIWKTVPPGLFRDPDKADNMGAFETVMSDGDPNFDYVWADYADKNLIIIWQLQMLCIDLNSGAVRWQKSL